MDVRPIRTEDDYEWALAEILRYFDKQPEVGSAEADRFDVLSELVVAYESRRFPPPEVDPIDALEAFMTDAGKSMSDLAELLGSASRASQALDRTRQLDVEDIRRLDRSWGLPAHLLVAPSRQAAE